ncbi:MAG TPA: anthranilate phosphoribosyltransferase [Gemmatimonadales bacterium]|nr:anthranilate phosphoribosyltransferase [Gemmatimonadales bacterium]
MIPVLQQALRKLSQGDSLTAAEATEAFGALMRGEASPALVAALLVALRVKGETADELAGAAAALRAVMVPLASDGRVLVDTCGTGGGAVATINLSTAAAFVARGAGIRLAKHGNRSFTSSCGSADVLEALGVDILLPPERAAAVLRETGIVFLFAPTYHPAMRHVAPVRRELGIATVMNLVGPLANPAGARRQVVGVADRARAPLVAQALARLGAEHALVVHGTVGMDEISPSGPTEVWEVRAGSVREWTIDPGRLGLKHDDLASLAGGAPPENARRIEAVLGGSERGAARAAVLLNAAAAILVAGAEASFEAALERAGEALDSGAAKDALDRLRAAAPRTG